MKYSITSISTALLGLFLFLLPWQTIYIFQAVSIRGSRWQSATVAIYLTELLLWLVIFFSLFVIRSHRKAGMRSMHLSRDRVMIISSALPVVYSYLSQLWAPLPYLALQQSLRLFAVLLLIYLFFIYTEKKYFLLISFISGAVIQSWIGIWQWWTQSSWSSSLLGMSQHLASETGTSILLGDGERWMRAYGAFAHPNIFGGYMLLGLMSLLIFLPRLVSLSANVRLLWIMSYLSLLLGLCTSWSRSALLGFLFLLVPLLFSFFSKQKDRIAGWILFFSLAVLCLFGLLFHSLVLARTGGANLVETRSISERVSGGAEALHLFRTHPIFGVGAGNYTAVQLMTQPDLAGWQLQPVHVVLLLLAVEYGIVGLVLFSLPLFFVWFFFLRQNGRWLRLLVGLLPLVPLLLFDHYLWTSWTGMCLVGLFIALFSDPSTRDTHTIHTSSTDYP